MPNTQNQQQNQAPQQNAQTPNAGQQAGQTQPATTPQSTGIFLSLDSPKFHPKHTAMDIIPNASEQIIGVRGQGIIIEDIEAFVVLKEDINTPESVLNLIANKKAMLINDGKGIR